MLGPLPVALAPTPHESPYQSHLDGQISRPLLHELLIALNKDADSTSRQLTSHKQGSPSQSKQYARAVSVVAALVDPLLPQCEDKPLLMSWNSLPTSIKN